MTYMGIEFESAEAIKTWSKEGNITEYRKLAKRFAENPSVELSFMMSRLADILVKTFGLTWDEVEEIELSVM